MASGVQEPKTSAFTSRSTPPPSISTASQPSPRGSQDPIATPSDQISHVTSPQKDTYIQGSSTNDGWTGSRRSKASLLSFWALTATLFLAALDTTLLPTALPTISKDFSIPDNLYSWTGSAYLLANASSVPFWGKLSDIFGRKPVVLVANVVFLVGAIVGGLAQDVGMLIAGRAIQGLGGGGLVILVHICVADMFEIRERGLYLGIVGAAWAVASALGPVLGGIFASKLTWRWCFWINIPIDTLAALTITFTLHLPNPRMSLLTGLRQIDWAGSLSVCAATLLLLIGLQTGSNTSFSGALSPTFITLGILSYIAFFLTQRYLSTSPIMPLRIFNNLSNLSALSVCFADALVFNSVAYFLPLYFQSVLSFSPSLSGILMLAVAIPLTLVSLASGFVIERTGRYLEVLRSGLALMTLGIGLLILLHSSNGKQELGMVIGFLVILGVGFGPNFHAPLIALQSRTRESDMAAATATFGFVRMVAGAIGVVLGQVVFQSRMRAFLAAFVKAGISGDLARELAGGDAIASSSAVAGLATAQRKLVRGGMVDALRWTWVFLTVVSGLGLVVSFGIRRSRLDRVEGGGTRDEEKGDGGSRA